MAELTVPWCGGELDVSLPRRWTLQQTAGPELKSAPADWPQRLAAALEQPGTGLPLSKLLQARPRGRVSVVVEDVTRGGPLAAILEVLMRELRFARVDPDRMEVVFATGIHPPMMAREVAEKLGLAGEGIRWRCNRCRESSGHVNLGRIGRVPVRIDRGVAGADLRIIVSSVSPHFQAGFGGGYRLLVPGCAHVETIRELNRLGIGPTERRLVGTEAGDNPMRKVIDAAGILIDQSGGRSFAVQYLLDEDSQPASITAGESIPTQRMLARQCSVACGIMVDQPADVLITNAHPRDFDLSQSVKCIANTRWAVRPGGVILALVSARVGLREASLPAWPVGPTWTRRVVRLLGPEAVCSLARRLAPSLALDAQPYLRLAVQMLYRNPIVLFAPFLHESGLVLPGVHVVATMERAIAAVEKLLPGRRRLRAIAFPAGGGTFPILSPAAGPAIPQA